MADVKVEQVTRAIHGFLSRRNIMQYLDNDEDCEGLARAAIAALATGRDDKLAETVKWLREKAEICKKQCSEYGLLEDDEASEEWRVRGDTFEFIASEIEHGQSPLSDTALRASTDERNAVIEPEADTLRFLRHRNEQRRAAIAEIIHECPKLKGEPSRDCIAALSGIAVAEAMAAIQHIAAIRALKDAPDA